MYFSGNGGGMLGRLCMACGVAWAVTAAAGGTQAQEPARPAAVFPTAGRGPAVDAKADKALEENDGSLFQPKGLEWGSFLVLPQVEAEQGWNSNVYATSADVKADSYSEVRPELKVRSRLDTHALNFSASADAVSFSERSSDNRIDGKAQADGRYDISDTAEINGLVLGAFGHEDRGGPDDAGGKEPTPTRTVDSRIGAAVRQVGYSFKGSVDVTRSEFEDVATSTGTLVNNHLRDRSEVTSSVQAGYEFLPNYSAEIEAVGIVRDYDAAVDSSGVRRDSKGYRLHGGLGIEVNDLIRGELMLGWMQQFYKDPSLSDPSGPSVRFSLNWTPSRLLLIVPSLERNIQETTRTGAAAMIRNSASIMVRWEYLPDVLITNTATVNLDDYSGLKNNGTVTFDETFRVIYAFTQQLHAGANFSYQNKIAEQTGGGFIQKKVGLLAKLQF